MKKIILLILSILSISCHADSFAPTATYSVCFTPQENCTQEIVTTIENAKSQIFVQAFTFSSRPIAKALVNAKNRGVLVKVLLDKNQIQDKYSALRYLSNNGVSAKIDYIPEDFGCAHNKVMIIDAHTVITGSFNFTKTAQRINAENVLIIHDAKLAEKYLQNWNARDNTAIYPKQFK